ncbi:hypothetical protein [Legionella sp. CNM-4043-24]|uniref:hypothetical protein n=1 Tax=Legionella sp. CNM-4043-24 TaxID=3421646 RepID=UPI00403AE864
MATIIYQGRIISNLNRYLKANNLPFKMNESGICNGLAMVHAEYALQNKTDEFMKILAFIATGKRDALITDELIDVFAVKVAATFSPGKFTHSFGQTGAIQMLSVNNKPLSSSFSFTLASSKQNWVETMSALNLQEGEVLQVQSETHSISIIKKNGQYAVYDPNYMWGYNTFSTEKKLVNELHNNVFGPTSGLASDQLAMSIQLIRHPEAPPRNLPCKTALYTRYLPSASNSSKTFTLNEAVVFSDEAETRLLLELTGNNPGKAAGFAVINNNKESLKPLIENISSADPLKIELLLSVAMKGGKKDILETLLENDVIKTHYFEDFLRHSPEIAINQAAGGGNPLLMASCLEHVREHDRALSEESIRRALETQFFESEEDKAYVTQMVKDQLADTLEPKYRERFVLTQGSPLDPILSAVQSGSAETLDVLFKSLGNTDALFRDETKMGWLLEAIRLNHSPVVTYLIEKNPGISRELLQSISMSPKAVERTHIQTLRILQSHGVPFSTVAESIIAKKESHSLTLLQSLGILLRKFTEFFREMRSTSNGIQYNPQLFRQAVKPSESIPVDEKRDDDTPVNALR